MRALLLVVLAAASPLIVPAKAPAAPPPGDERELVDRVNAGINKGVSFLRAAHRPDQQWEGYFLSKVAQIDGGVTALAALALLQCGEKPDLPELRSALEYIRTRKRSSTYVVALSTMALAEARQARDLPVIQGNVDWLLKNAIRRSGKISGWSYYENGGGPGGDAGGDGSNTQYALLGLYAGKQAGAKIPDADWEAIYRLYLTSQEQLPDGTGRWAYSLNRENFNPSHYNMTVAGVSGLVIASLGWGRSQQQLDPSTGVAAKCGFYEENAALKRGLNYVGKNFRFETRGPALGADFYGIYGTERAGRLSGQRFLGTVDWYRKGCEYLTGSQRKDGAWSNTGPDASDEGNSTVIATSFSLLFLSKGRTPVLISKLAWGEAKFDAQGVFSERELEGGVIPWNRKRNDARHLTEFASRELFKGLPLGWQSYDPRRKDLATDADILAEVGALVQSPILFVNGHERPRLTGQQKQLFKRYIEEGGFVIAEACCGSAAFTDGMRDLLSELFPENKLRVLPPQHPIWQSYFAVPPSEFPKLEGLERGCRTVMVLSPEPLAGYWEESKYMPKGADDAKNRGEQAFRLGGNIIAYATGLEPPQQRGAVRNIADAKNDKAPPRGFLKPAQLKLSGEAAPAPAAMRNLMGHLRNKFALDVVLGQDDLAASSESLFKYRFLYLHGKRRFQFDDDELKGLRATLQAGGLLLADSACGKPEFDEAFRKEVARLFPAAKLEPIPLDDELFSADINGQGAAIATVKRRDKPGGSGPDAGYADVPPALEGVKVDGRWAVIYSRYDLGCSLEGHRSTDCLGHTRESALRLGSAAALYLLKRDEKAR